MRPAQTFDAALLLQAQGIRAIILDVDGVLTDGGLLFGADGEQMKRFHTLDGHGLKLLARAGLRVGVISGRDSAALRVRLAALGVDDVALGVHTKLEAATEMLSRWQLHWPQVATMGDDWPDLPLMRACGLAFAPPNAHVEVIACAHHVTQAAGGAGAVREACDVLLQGSGHYAVLLEQDAQTGAVEDGSQAQR